jgi:ankyrin repeat protein
MQHKLLNTSRTLVAALVCIASVSCSKDDGSASPHAAGTSTDALPEAQVVDIVNAVSAGDAEKARTMLDANPKLVKAQLNAGGTYSGWPLIVIAASNGNQPIVERLLAAGADANEKNSSNEAALHYAARGGHKGIVELLIAHNADVNAKSDAEATPLLAATAAGKTDVAGLLRAHGAKE